MYSPLRFSVYARDLKEAIYQMLEERQTRIIGSNKFVTLNGKTVMVSAEATDQEIATALNLDKIDATAKVPAVAVQASVPAKGSFAASLRSVMNEARAGLDKARADGIAQVQVAVEKLSTAKESVSKVSGQIAKTISDEADEVMAELGQISNDL
jgi:hypothetical protein